MNESAASSGHVQQLQEMLLPVLAIGPDFLAGRRDADEMANTMVGATKAHVKERRAQGQAVPESPETTELEATIAEIYGCGAGYLRQLCDSACVARTITQIMGEYGDLTAGKSG